MGEAEDVLYDALPTIEGVNARWGHKAPIMSRRRRRPRRKEPVDPGAFFLAIVIAIGVPVVIGVVQALGAIGVLLMLSLCIGVAVVYQRRKERQEQEEIRRQEERRHRATPIGPISIKSAVRHPTRRCIEYARIWFQDYLYRVRT
jgi:hypothetical protein